MSLNRCWLAWSLSTSSRPCLVTVDLKSYAFSRTTLLLVFLREDEPLSRERMPGFSTTMVATSTQALLICIEMFVQRPATPTR